jgi:CTP synthase
MFCHVSSDQVIGIHDLSSTYHVPLLLESQGIIPYFQKRLNLHSLNIPPALKDRGLLLSRRWNAMTKV